MNYDVDLIRGLMLALEDRQLSPRATVVISLAEEALDFGCRPEEIGVCLNVLLGLDYIDGAGDDEPGFWLFRKLTRKGTTFVEKVRVPRDWDRIKRHYGRQSADPAH